MSLDDFSKRYFEQRKRQEGHPIDRFYKMSDKLQFVSLLATGFLNNHYYMKGEEVLELSKVLHQTVVKQDPRFHIAALKFFRNIAFIKDQILIGLAAQQNVQQFYDTELELLRTMPPKLVLRWVNFLRTGYMDHGFSSRQKRLVRDYLQNMPPELMEYYAMRYLRIMRKLIRISHPKLTGIHHDIAGWIVTNPARRKAPTDRLKVFESFLQERNTENRLKMILDHDLPFELLRSHISKESANSYSDITKEILYKTMTPSGVIFNLRYVMDVMNEEETIRLIEQKIEKSKSKVSIFDIVRAALAVQRRSELVANKLFSIAEKRVEQIKQYLLEALPEPKVTIVLDVSGSMWDRPVYYSLIMASLLMPLVENVVIFSDEAHDWHKFTLSEIGSEMGKLSNYSGCTNMTAGIRKALQTDSNTIFVFTDEQENALTEGKQAMDVIKQSEKHIFVFNPEPYPAHAVNPNHPLVHYLPMTTPETILASLRLRQLYSLDEEKTKEYVLQRVKIF